MFFRACGMALAWNLTHSIGGVRLYVHDDLQRSWRRLRGEISSRPITHWCVVATLVHRSDERQRQEYTFARRQNFIHVTTADSVLYPFWSWNNGQQDDTNDSMEQPKQSPHNSHIKSQNSCKLSFQLYFKKFHKIRQSIRIEFFIFSWLIIVYSK